jgi:glycosyltransferase involved in cell wall biosynthesis
MLGPLGLLGGALRTARAYPPLVVRFLSAERPDAILVGYMGQLDVLVMWPFARLRGIPVLWDQFLSAYDTVVDDRRKVSSRHPLAKALYAWEWLACRAADRVLMDTLAHAAYVVDTFKLAPARVSSGWVGAETSLFPPVESAPPVLEPERSSRTARPPLVVLFYGQFIPLHGVDTIVRAARLLREHPIEFVLIGSGQEHARVAALLAEEPLDNLKWHAWLEYERLSEAIARADVCLGIFGPTPKASRVIPNKVFQILSARKPLITQDSPASREIFDDQTP